jgi:hypothetical protein
MDNNFQRIGASNNAHVGRDFEIKVRDFFKTIDLDLDKNVIVDIGVCNESRPHRFDLGGVQKNIVVECKSHTWTVGGNIPSAKLTTWDQAMYYFFLTPKKYRKIFVVLYDYSEKHHSSLGAYYLRTRYHLIPSDVEFWEFDETKNIAEKIK